MSERKPDLKPILKLIERSPDVGDGWRNVSPILVKLIESYPDQTLIEWQRLEGGAARVRMSSKGETVLPYMGAR